MCVAANGECVLPRGIVSILRRTPKYEMVSCKSYLTLTERTLRAAEALTATRWPTRAEDMVMEAILRGEARGEGKRVSGAGLLGGRVTTLHSKKTRHLHTLFCQK